jgi:hypothetical protein
MNSSRFRGRIFSANGLDAGGSLFFSMAPVLPLFSPAALFYLLSSASLAEDDSDGGVFQTGLRTDLINKVALV